MKVIVAKFGGSSTASAGRIRKIAALLREDPARRCVVLSAPGAPEGGEKVTSLLYRCWAVRQRAGETVPLIAQVAERYAVIAGALGVPFSLEHTRRELEAALAISEAATVSRGEYLCARLFSQWSGIPMLDAARLVVFDEAGKLNEAETLRRFSEMVLPRPRVIVPGFYGADAQGRIHALPRNGSDVTGALAAAGIGAAVYENWSDVPGLMTADPAVVPSARPIPRIGIRQMRALAEAGAQVLHPDALGPVERAGIDTHLRSTLRPEAPGTLITKDCDAVAPCVAYKDLSNGCSRITAFGLPQAARASLIAELSPMKVEEDIASVLRLEVPRANRDHALFAVHDRLPVE